MKYFVVLTRELQSRDVIRFEGITSTALLATLPPVHSLNTERYMMSSSS